jgi:Zn-dependent peptidase ImmA (M78 family)
MCKEFLINIRNKRKDIDDMATRAQEVLNYFHIENISSGVPIVEILKKFNFKIFQSDLDADSLSAYIAVDPKFEEIFGSNKVTCVNVNDNIGHKRFALAHELAHYIFDFNENEDLYYYDTYSEKETDDNFEEKRANKFAANLLMPEKEFRKKFEELQTLQSKVDIVNEIGKYFVVSSTAVLKRFCELGYDNYVEM